MNPRPRRDNDDPARSRRSLPVLAAVALVLASACGSATPNASGPSALTSPSATTTASPAASSAFASAPASTAPAASPGGDWIGFHGDASRSGVASAGPIGHPVVTWRAHANGGVPSNVVIAGDAVFFASDDGVVQAVDRASGAGRWGITFDAPIQRGPVAADGRLYVIAGSGAPMALDPATGRTIWTSAKAYQNASEVASDGTLLYFGTGDGSLVAMDASSGAERWTLKPSASTTAVHSPAVANGRVYVGTVGGGYVAVDAATHTVIWTGDTGSDSTGTAAVGGGLAFIGTAIDVPTGHLRAFDTQTGQLRWTADQPLLQFPTITNETAYSATQEGLVAALDLATGKARWTVQLHGKVRPMAVAGSILYLAADAEEKVYALDTMTGGRLWSFDIDGADDCCIAVAHGSVFVGTMSGSVYAIAGDGAQIGAAPDSGATSSPIPTGSIAPLAELQVKVAWTTDLRGRPFVPISQIAIDPKGRIWAPEGNGDKFAILDANGKLLEEWGSSGSGPGQFDLTRQNGDGYGTLAFAKDGSFFVLDVGNRRIQRFSATRRFISEWGGFGTKPGAFIDPVGIVVAADGSVWILDDKRKVAEHFDADGKVLGSFDPFANVPHNEGANSLAIDAAGHLYITQITPNQVAEFTAEGSLVRTFGDGQLFIDQPTQMAIDAEGRLLVTASERGRVGVIAFAPDGTVLGGFGPHGSGLGEMVFPAGIALDRSGHVYVEDSSPDSARLIRFDMTP